MFPQQYRVWLVIKELIVISTEKHSSDEIQKKVPHPPDRQMSHII